MLFKIIFSYASHVTCDTYDIRCTINQKVVDWLSESTSQVLTYYDLPSDQPLMNLVQLYTLLKYLRYFGQTGQVIN